MIDDKPSVFAYVQAASNEFEESQLKDLYLDAVCNKESEDSESVICRAYLEGKRGDIPTWLDEEPTVKSIFEQFSAGIVEVYAGKKYKPVDKKVRPVYEDLPQKFRIIREIKGDPLENMPVLSPNPPDFVPKGRYTLERKQHMDKVHDQEFLLPEEMKLVHHLIAEQNQAFAWDDTERGSFREDFFPPVQMPVIPHKPWVLKNIPIPPGIREEVCRIIKTKEAAGVYEPSNSSYRSRWFCVIKKDGKSLRLVHSLEPLNAVTIAHSGLPPATEDLAERFAGRACGGMFDLYVGYDERKLAVESRDLTTFQTPFGARRLVTLPMGWTNSVPIFHDDVTHILQDEVPEFTEPYIDDVGVKGPKTRYELADGTHERIPENEGIRRFVWEHVQNVNRILQRMKYSGGTFSGLKSLVCGDEIVVVGHRVTYEGRKPELDKFGAIMRWGPCKDVHDVRAFLGTAGTCRMFIKDYARITQPLTHLLRTKVPFEWGENQENAMKEVKDLLSVCPALKPIDYHSDAPVILGVDTSWMAVGFWICQEDPDDSKKRYYARFASITLSDREARYSQPKRELFGLFRALQEAKFWLLGCRKLIIETDAKYIKGMVNNPTLGPNAAVCRWIEYILMFHFDLRHIPGKTFSADGLSRRRPQPGDPEYPLDDEWIDEPDGPPKFEYPDLENGLPNAEANLPLEFESFKRDIDTRGGYLLSLGVRRFMSQASRNIEQTVFECSPEIWYELRDAEEEAIEDKEFEPPEVSGLAKTVACFKVELQTARQQTVSDSDLIKHSIIRCGSETDALDSYDLFMTERMLPEVELDNDGESREAYDEEHRTETAKRQDEQLPLVKAWLNNPFRRPEDLTDKQYKAFIKKARKFFVDDNDRLYKKSSDTSHKLVVNKDRRMYMMEASHDNLGHRGGYATKSLIMERFWWPEIERDVYQYVKTCHICQERQKTLLRIPPTVTHTPGLFQVLHADVLHMTPASNKCKYIVHGRCALSSWMEGRPLQQENARSIGLWIFEDIICRWGCIVMIVTDNAGPFTKALAWLEQKYGIKGITISAYNSKANGRIERPHWDVRQALYKATGGDVAKWFWFFCLVMWADRITVRKGLGCSPYFITTGAHPTLPLDVIEATWLVELPDGPLTTEELIGYRAQALAKHAVHVDAMRKRVTKRKLDAVLRYERDHKNKIKDYIFKPRDLVLIRNTAVENSLDKKMKPRYLGPMVVVTRNKGGAYIVAELDGSVWQEKVGAFRIIPYYARRRIDLPRDLLDFIDISEATLKDLQESTDPPKIMEDIWFDRVDINPGQAEVSDNEEDEDSDLGESDGSESENEPGLRASSRLKAKTGGQ
jgi:Integrase zinc binding domain/RNase H-like domain found in reverse transcriptase